MATGGLILLLIAFWLNKNKPVGYVAFIVTVVYLMNMWLAQSVLDRHVINTFSYYVSQSGFEVLVAVMLAQKPMVEGVVIMSLCLVAVIANIIGFCASVLGVQIDYLVYVSMWVLFSVQVIVLLSKKAANDLYRSITKPDFIYSFCSNYLRLDSKDYWSSK